MEYYSHKKWEEDITVISGISGENMFLIEGKDKAVLRSEERRVGKECL